MKIFLALLFLTATAQAEPTPSAVLKNDQGISELKGGNMGAAQEKFLTGLADTPLEARLHYNLGLSFEAQGQVDKAQASYSTALKLAQDGFTKFAANFNLGELAQKAKKTDEALAYYQEALKYNPNSQETKINIELLTQDQQGKGQGDSKDDKDDQKDQKDKDGKGKGDQDKESKDNKPDDKKDEKKKEDQPKEYAKNKPQPRKFKSEELTQGDVNKILGEIKQQEQKIRAEFNKKEVKDQPRDKDW